MQIFPHFSFKKPFAVACSRNGDIIVANSGEDRLLIFNQDKKLIHTIGKSGARVGEFNHPLGVAVDGRNGNIAVADTFNHRVQVLSEQGQFLFSFGAQGAGLGQLDNPMGIAITQDGKFVVCEQSNHRVQVFDRAGKPLMVVGNQDSFNSPKGMALLSDGHVVVCDGNGAIFLISLDGRISPLCSNIAFKGLRHVAVDDADRLYFADKKKGEVKVFSRKGEFLGSLGKGSFSSPSGIALDGAGRILVADVSASTIVALTPKS